MSATTFSSSSILDRRNSSLAMAGGRVPLPPGHAVQNPLSENKANVSSRISRTIASKSARVSLRLSGSVTNSKRCGGCPCSRNSASIVPAWNPGDQRHIAASGRGARNASSLLSSISRSAVAASGAFRATRRNTRRSHGWRRERPHRGSARPANWRLQSRLEGSGSPRRFFL